MYIYIDVFFRDIILYNIVHIVKEELYCSVDVCYAFECRNNDKLNVKIFRVFSFSFFAESIVCTWIGKSKKIKCLFFFGFFYAAQRKNAMSVKKRFVNNFERHDWKEISQDVILYSMMSYLMTFFIYESYLMEFFIYESSNYLFRFAEKNCFYLLLIIEAHTFYTYMFVICNIILRKKGIR